LEENVTGNKYILGWPSWHAWQTGDYIQGLSRKDFPWISLQFNSPSGWEWHLPSTGHSIEFWQPLFNHLAILASSLRCLKNVSIPDQKQKSAQMNIIILWSAHTVWEQITMETEGHKPKKS
jgi:hypothetical protein